MFDKMISGNNIIFDKKIENATNVEYELGLLTKTIKIQKSLFITDDLGRNNPVNIDDPEYVFLDIKKYRIEESLFDWQTQEKITTTQLDKKYLKSKDLKNIFTIQ